MKSNSTPILLWICLFSLTFADKQIDTLNILFPEAYKESSGKSIELVTTEGGCFDWTSSSPEVITVTGISGDETNCYRKGVIQLKHVGAYPASVYITATNTETQELSNIPVRIRPITRIQIIAKSKLMNINEIQDLSIFAYDSDQNMFTSLQGLKFEWQLVENSNILSKISLKNSHLILPLNQRKNIEMKGSQSDILVIKGDNPGKAIVRVRCIEPGYEQLKNQITVSVHERFDISPSLPTYVMINSTLKFSLITPSRQEIAIPKSYYKTTLSSSKFKVSDTLILKSPVQQGQTVLKVEDIRTLPPYFADVTIYAKDPTSMSLDLDDYMIVGEQTKVQINFFWDKNLLQGFNADAKVTSDLPYDQTKRIIKGNQKRTGFIKATYKQLSAEKKVTVVYPLKQVLPSNKIILPVEETFELKVVGGSGVYEYKIEGGDFAIISTSGVISTRKEGNGKIIVIDKRIPRNKIILDLFVSPVNSLTPLEGYKELNVNQYGPIFTVGKNKNYEQYTKCSEQNIMLQTSHLPIFETSTDNSFSKSLRVLQNKMGQSSVVKNALMKNALIPLGVYDFISKFSIYTTAEQISIDQLTMYARELENYGICSAFWVKGSQHYDEMMEVYLKQNTHVRSKFYLRVYDKISNNVSKQGEDSFIMTPLASLNWKTIGGSYDWDAKTRTLLNDVQYNTEYPTVKCTDKESLMEMKIQKINPESTKLLLPVNQTKKIYIICKYPSQLKIKYEKKTFETNVINGLKDQVIKGQLIPFDSKGEPFYNSSNLIYEFEKTAGNLKINSNEFEFDSQGAKAAKVIFWTQKISGLNFKFNKVSANFSYNVQQMFQISPLPQNYYLLTLFNQKTAYIFRLMRISQNAEVQCEGSIECNLLIATKQVAVKTSRLGSGKMTITDKLIYAYPTMTITFDVVDADQIVVFLNKKTTEVQKKLIAEVNLLYQGKVIPTWQYDTGNLLLVHEAGIRSKEIVSSLPSGPSNRYEISTQKPGLYKLIAEQHYPKYLQSAPVLLKVYPRFEVNIPNLLQSYSPEDVLQLKGQLTVAVNCARKIHLYGGPDTLSVESLVENYDFAHVQILDQNTRGIEIIGVNEGKTKVTLTVKSAAQDKLTIALIFLQVIVKQIDYATIYSLQDAVVNAQFRVIPYLIVDDELMVDSICDFEYKWSSNNNIKLQGLNNKRLGINATAVAEGQSFVKLEVFKNSKLLFTSTKQITVHKSLDIQLPTIIGQKQNAISTNLLLPQNSGLDLDSNILAKKISECNQNVLSISQNKLITSRQKGMVSIKLQKTNDNTYSNYMNVFVTQIKALFIENNHGQVLAEIDKVTKVKFHVQDMYGRLFYNNLFNVEYDIISSNEDIFTVSIDATKNYINIHPKKQGEAKLILRLQSSQGKSGLTKLLEIPHDIVSVQVGKIIEPHSPIYLAVGGQVAIQYSGKEGSKWVVVSGGKFVEINIASKKITGLHPGEAIISIGGHQVIVRILEPTVKRKVVQKPIPGKATLITEYIMAGKWQDQEVLLPSISDNYSYINNNLNLTCVPTLPNWFTSKSKIIKEQYHEKLRCETTMIQNVEAQDTFPDELEVSLIKIDQKKIPKILHTSREPISSTFWLPKAFEQIFLSSEKLRTQIFIRSQQKLIIDVIGGKQSWITEAFDISGQIEVVSLQVQAKSSNYDFKIRISHPSSDQTEDIIVKYIADESTRHAEEAVETQKREQRKEDETQADSFDIMGVFMQSHWTDYIIVIMAIIFLLILISQKCIGSDSDGKFHCL